MNTSWAQQTNLNSPHYAGESSVSLHRMPPFFFHVTSPQHLTVRTRRGPHLLLVRRGPPHYASRCPSETHRGGSRLLLSIQRRRIRLQIHSLVGTPTQHRQLRGRLQQSERRCNLHRHSTRIPQEKLSRCHRGGEARAVREGVYDHCQGGEGSIRCREAKGRVRDGGDVVALHPARGGAA